MAFFKFRRGADEATSAPAQPPSVEVIRQRAKYRLVGATVLVLAGVILFPLLLDSQPRSVAVNTPIDIPDKNKMPPLVIPPAADADKTAAKTVTAPASDIITEDAGPARTVMNSERKTTPALAASAPNATSIESTAIAKPAGVTKPDGSAASKPAAPVAVAASTPRSASADAAATAILSKASDGARAKALLEGGASTDAQAIPGRFIVQVGAFADATRAREVRLKVEHAGLKTYTHVAETKEGRRIRVRVGPYPTRDEAEKAAAKIRKLDLPAALLTL
jgi:DedD protein